MNHEQELILIAVLSNAFGVLIGHIRVERERRKVITFLGLVSEESVLGPDELRVAITEPRERERWRRQIEALHRERRSRQESDPPPT